jgi:phage tail tube protein FII
MSAKRHMHFTNLFVDVDYSFGEVMLITEF